MDPDKDDRPFAKKLPEPLDVPHLHLYTKDLRALLPKRWRRKRKGPPVK